MTTELSTSSSVRDEEAGSCECGDTSAHLDACGPDGLPSWGVATHQNQRQYQEDAYHVELSEEAHPCHSFLVLDGHGGSHVSSYCATHLAAQFRQRLLAARPPTGDEGQRAVQQATAVASSMRAAFLACHEQLRSDGAAQLSGAAAVMAVVTQQYIVTGHCGDSRAVLSRGQRAMPLTRDHKPNRPDEEARIRAAGGRVVWSGGFRVMGALSMSRAIGDHAFADFGVVASPDVAVLERCADVDDFLLLASDGMFDAVTSQEAVDVAHRLLQRAAERALPRAACAALVPKVLTQLAMSRGSHDNITCVFVDLRCRVPRGAQPLLQRGGPGASLSSAAAAAAALLAPSPPPSAAASPPPPEAPTAPASLPPKGRKGGSEAAAKPSRGPAADAADGARAPPPARSAGADGGLLAAPGLPAVLARLFAGLPAPKPAAGAVTTPVQAAPPAQAPPPPPEALPRSAASQRRAVAASDAPLGFLRDAWRQPQQAKAKAAAAAAAATAVPPNAAGPGYIGPRLAATLAVLKRSAAQRPATQQGAPPAAAPAPPPAAPPPQVPASARQPPPPKPGAPTVPSARRTKRGPAPCSTAAAAAGRQEQARAAKKRRCAGELHLPLDATDLRTVAADTAAGSVGRLSSWNTLLAASALLALRECAP